ncbi:MAG: hypothetical protein R6V04_15515 [bacterium]
MDNKNFRILYVKCIITLMIFFMQYSNPSAAGAQVPFPTIHKPPVPYHMQYVNFQTLQLDILGDYASGMIGDPYADLSWNPAFITSRSQSTLYVKVNFNQASSTSSYYINPDYGNSYTVLPRWYNTSGINLLNTEPVYHIAYLKPITSKFCLGVVNRTMVDYGPYRSTGWWDDRGWDTDKIIPENDYNLEPQTLEVDENNQQVWGNHVEIFLGYKWSPSLSIGLKLGHYFFRRDGNLYDSKWGYHPHYSYADLNDELLNINGDQYECGLGFIYHVDKNTSLGMYGSYMIGSTRDDRAVQDTLDNWSETAEDTRYYSLRKYDLMRNEEYSSDDTQPLFSLVFEKKVSQNITLRSFLKSSWLNSDVSGTIDSHDTTYADRTYDYYHNQQYYFRRQRNYYKSIANLHGDGNTSSSTVQWFTSIIYAPDEKWSLFSGIYFSRTVLDREITETSDYLNRYFSEYSEYDPETRRRQYSQEKNYVYTFHSEQWDCILPIGFRLSMVKGFDILLGAHLSFIGYDSKEKGSVVYPRKLEQRWIDGELVVSDLEENRYELYTSDPSFSLQRDTDIHLGARYEHSSGIRVFFRTEGNLSDMDYWALGFEVIL